MSQIVGWLTGGDLRSDGLANEAAEFVLQNPGACRELAVGLKSSEDVIRGRTADALEKVARSRPDLVAVHLATLLQTSKQDPVAIVRMHVAMILGHLVPVQEPLQDLVSALMDMLEDDSAFVVSWAITSLCIICRQEDVHVAAVLPKIVELASGGGPAIRTRASKAKDLLLDPDRPFPRGWAKSTFLDEFGSVCGRPDSH